MKLIAYLLRNSPRSMVLAVLAGIISGAVNIGLLALFNIVLRGRDVYPRQTLVWSFVALCFSLPLTRFISETLLARVSQESLFNLRLSLSKQITTAPLRHLEQLGAHRLLTALTEDIPTITNALLFIPVLCVNLAVVFFGLLYLSSLSLAVLGVVLGFMALGIITYQLPTLKAMKALQRAREYTDDLFSHFRDLTGGIKELKLHRARRMAFLSDVLLSTAASVRDRNTTGLTIFAAASSWGQTLVFVVIGLIMFAWPALRPVDLATLTAYTITLLYLMNPLQVLMNLIPSLGRASIALQKLETLGVELTSMGLDGQDDVEPGELARFDRLDLVDVVHTYRREGESTDFVLGPVNLTIFPKEILFLTGGNGSGKTTLAKLLTGLYVPAAGEILLNGKPITDENRELYRQHFSVVFSDFHLFDSLLGMNRAKLDNRANEYLSQLQLDHKVQVKEATLSTTELSQGQRKRLALLTAYLEDRPIYIFDEWAADQDPQFKEVFYYQLVPELKALGKTIVVISHDDRFYHVADRILKLDYGKLVSLNQVDQSISVASSRAGD